MTQLTVEETKISQLPRFPSTPPLPISPRKYWLLQMAQKKEKTTICDAAITVLAWSPDASRVALSPNNHLIDIYSCEGSTDCTKWVLQGTLEQHAQSVSGIAWGKTSGLIASCAQDRTAFVWKEEERGRWTPTRVMLDSSVKRGLTAITFNSLEDRIYISSAAFNVAIGKADPTEPFWTCTVVQPHKSTVTCLAAHPGQEHDRVVASGSTDNTAKIFTYKGRTMTELASFKTRGWVNCVTWSKSGTVLAFATHASEVYFATGTFPQFNTFVAVPVTLSLLPLRSVSFIGDEIVIGGGYDFYPIALKQAGGVWKVEGKFTAPAQQALKREMSATELARSRFQNESSFGQAETIELPSTKHTNTISVVTALPEAADKTFKKALQFATSSMDGRVELWNLDEMQ